MDLTAGTVVEKYTVQRVLGEGGMAVVYLCRHNSLGTAHALKVLTLSSRAIRERLVQEGRVQASLRHRNIVAVTDIITLNGAPGLVMEYIEGPSLDDLIEQRPLTLEQVEVLATGILDAVAHAHAQGLVHRDLKPANIMLSLEASTLVPKVTDFGLAKLLEGAPGRAATRTGSTMGTPHYMSPEQVADSKNVDHRTDVFALGAILYEMVCGRRAFGGENLLQIFNAAANGQFTHPRELVPELPERMEKAILGALEPDRDRRIQTVAELRAVWTGQASTTAGVVPDGPAGPFDAEFMSAVSASSGSAPPVASGPPSSATWAGESVIASSAAPPVSVETLHQGPPVEPKAAEPVAEVPADSMVPGAAVVVGGGAAFLLAGSVAAIGLLGLVGVGGYLAFRSGTPAQPVAVAPVPEPVAVVDPEPVVEEPDATPSPSPTRPRPVRSRAQPTRPAVVAPTPTEPVPAEPTEPVPAEPTEPAPSEDMPEFTPPEPPVQAATPTFAGLDDPDPGKREAALDNLRSHTGATAAILDRARNDESRAVQIKAWQVASWRYKNGIGDEASQEALMLDALRSGRFSRREAANALGAASRDAQPLVDEMGKHAALVERAIVGAAVRIAKRHGDQRPIVEPAIESSLARASNMISRKFYQGKLNELR